MLGNYKQQTTSADDIWNSIWKPVIPYQYTSQRGINIFTEIDKELRLENKVQKPLLRW